MSPRALLNCGSLGLATWIKVFVLLGSSTTLSAAARLVQASEEARQQMVAFSEHGLHLNPRVAGDEIKVCANAPVGPRLIESRHHCYDYAKT